MKRALLILFVGSLLSSCTTTAPSTSPERNAKLNHSFALQSKISSAACQRYRLTVEGKDVSVSVFKNFRDIAYSSGTLDVNINEDQGIVMEHQRYIVPQTIQFTDRVLDALIRKQELMLAEAEAKALAELGVNGVSTNAIARQNESVAK